MKTASVVEFKTHLGRYLGLVSQGEKVVVTSHRTPVACLVQAEGRPGAITIRDPLCPGSDVDGLGPVRLAKKVDGVEALLQERGRR